MSLLTRARTRPAPAPVDDNAEGCIPIGEVAWRHRARVDGRIRSMRVRPWGDAASLEATVYDDTGGLVLVFLGRREVAGVHLGGRIVAEGMVGDHHGVLSILNPVYELRP
jgi:hypothetical protein